MIKVRIKKFQSRIAIIIIIFISFLFAYFSINSFNKEYLVQIRDTNELESIVNGIIYFGRPSCPNCIKFEPTLKRMITQNKTTVYYFNTDYFRENELLPEEELGKIFQRFTVEEVPLMVVLTNGSLTGMFNPNRIYNGTQDSMMKELSAFLNEYVNYSEQYIPHYTVYIILAIISAFIFLYVFIREEINLSNNSLSFFTVFLLNLAIMILLYRNFTLSVKYLDATGFSGNVIYGALAIVSFILCIISILKLIVIKYSNE